jgi:biopolymer transport protein ExbD
MMLKNKSDSARKKVIAEINITPLTDIFLVLLIIMMVVAPLAKQSPHQIKVPSAKGGVELKEMKTVVDVGKGGEYFVNGEQAAADGLAEKLLAAGPPEEGAVLIIRGDKSAKSRDIMRVLAAAKEAKFKHVTVAVESVPSAAESSI